MQSLPAGKAEWSGRTAGKKYQSFPTLWIHFARKIQPILCASDAIGAVILLTKSEKTALGDTERALIRTAAGFLGRQMEQ